MRFYKIELAGSFLPDAPSTRKLGDTGSEFLEVHSDDFMGALTGDVKADDGNAIITSGADRANSWASLATIRATNGTGIVLTTNTTVANSTFAGIAERAKYA